jgi:hypothetical protein
MPSFLLLTSRLIASYVQGPFSWIKYWENNIRIHSRPTACMLLMAFFSLCSISLMAQPAIQWDKAFGGTGTDELLTVQQTTDGGYVLGGRSNTNQNGDKTEASFNTYQDYWIVKLDATGKKEWDKAYGSNNGGYFASLRQTPDGGYITGGTVNSGIGRDKTDKRKSVGDFWIVKIAADGSKEWDKSYGGAISQRLTSIELTSDGGYLFAGISSSNAGIDKSEDSRGDSDYWIIKTDAAGNKQWDVTLGGAGYEQLGEAKQVSDGGYLISGHSISGASGDKTESSKGSSDYWIVKLRADGTKEWDKTIGGATSDFNCMFVETSDQGYLLSGISYSGVSGDKTEIGKGSSDYWVVKITDKGSVQWDKSFGSTEYDEFMRMVRARDGGYILAGRSAGPVSADKSEPSRDNGEYSDFWLVKIDENGNKVWDKTIGSAGTDGLNTIANTADGGIIVGGSSSGSGFERSQPLKGLSDYWFVKLAPENTQLPPTPIRINAGGPEFTTATKKKFSADLYYSGINRTSSVVSGDILNTSNDVLYQSARCSPTFSYNIPVANGTVDVYLHFAETYFGAPGKKGGLGSRRFHVNIEGVRKLTNYDIFAKAGGAMLATAEIFTVNVTDGMLNIDFLTGIADLPRISAIEVIRTNYALKPVADSYVRDGIYNRTNYGDVTSMEVKNNASDPSVRRSSYLKFQLPAATPVASAKLRIYGQASGRSSLYKVHAYGVNDDSWTENSILKVNAPAASTPSVGFTNTYVADQYEFYEIDVTSYVKAQQQSGDLTVSLLLNDPNNRNMRFVFNSKENAANPPQLVIVPGTVTNSNTREGVEEISSGAEAEPESSSVYPNPVGKQFTVAISSKHSQDISLDLLNNSGQSYQIVTTQKAIAGQKAEVDISGLSLNSGIYLLKIKSEAATEVIKVLVTD